MSGRARKNIPGIQKAIKEAAPFVLDPDPAPGVVDVEIKETLDVFLVKLGQEELSGILSYCVLELYNNALKANLKRAFFARKGLRIDSPEAYEQGMRSFRREMQEGAGANFKLLKDEGLKAVLVFRLAGDALELSVKNNTVLAVQEETRIAERIRRSFAFSSLEEALGSIDETEGAGLGIIIVVLALKKLGLDQDSFKVSSAGGETVAYLAIPMSSEMKERRRELADSLIDFVGKLPELPENIHRLRTMLADRLTPMHEIARTIAADPAMSAETLKLANSAAYAASKTADIVEAVVRVGVHGLNGVILSLGVQAVLGKKTEFLRALWERSYRTAWYARSIARNLLKRKDLLDDAYAGGLLLELGTMVLNAVDSETEKRIRAHCDRRGQSPAAFEQVLKGLDNATVGALAAEKWNFPTNLVEAIRHRHDPFRAPASSRTFVQAVYLADCMSRFADSGASFDRFDPEALAVFGIADRAAFVAQFERMTAEIRAKPY